MTEAKARSTNRILLGAHMSIGGGVHTAIERGCSIKCTAIQMFVKNNMQWFAHPLTRDEIRAFLNHQQRGQLLSIFAHANYLINLAAINPQFHANSIRALSEELIRADQLELPFLVLHPGAHVGAGEEAGVERIVASIDRVFRKIPKVKTRIALETTAGQGSCLGHTFEQSPASSTMCASRSGFAFASTPRICSPQATISETNPAFEKLFANSIA